MPTACCSGGEEREARQYFIDRGLPRSRDRPAQQPVLRHRHPACILVLNKAGSAGEKARLHQRRPRIPRGQGAEPPAPEDIDKIVHAYRAGPEHRRLRQTWCRWPTSRPKTTTATSAAMSTTPPAGAARRARPSARRACPWRDRRPGPLLAELRACAKAFVPRAAEHAAPGTPTSPLPSPDKRDIIADTSTATPASPSATPSSHGRSGRLRQRHLPRHRGVRPRFRQPACRWHVMALRSARRWTGIERTFAASTC